ncbi:HD domain-containing protein, partial [Thomasclavelia cocleata]|uniref:HD domain-containing protein n=1 Tax=Thomasclavelia cocleata TaxID=69824 RepID=UPI002431DAEE
VACYHDVGRSLNFNSIKHGELSWILVKRFLSDKELNKDLIKYLIINHNNKHLAQININLSIIYDADVLDLTRFKSKIIDKSNFINKNSIKKLEELLNEKN